jgi:hypothetical protein
MDGRRRGGVLRPGRRRRGGPGAGVAGGGRPGEGAGGAERGPAALDRDGRRRGEFGIFDGRRRGAVARHAGGTPPRLVGRRAGDGAAVGGGAAGGGAGALDGVGGAGRAVERRRSLAVDPGGAEPGGAAQGPGGIFGRLGRPGRGRGPLGRGPARRGRGAHLRDGGGHRRRRAPAAGRPAARAGRGGTARRGGRAVGGVDRWWSGRPPCGTTWWPPCWRGRAAGRGGCCSRIGLLREKDVDGLDNRRALLEIIVGARRARRRRAAPFDRARPVAGGHPLPGRRTARC